MPWSEEMSRKPYVREVSKTTWFLSHPRYMRYMAREVTCIFIVAYTFLLIVALAAPVARRRKRSRPFCRRCVAPWGYCSTCGCLDRSGVPQHVVVQRHAQGHAHPDR